MMLSSSHFNNQTYILHVCLSSCSVCLFLSNKHQIYLFTIISLEGDYSSSVPSRFAVSSCLKVGLVLEMNQSLQCIGQGLWTNK